MYGSNSEFYPLASRYEPPSRVVAQFPDGEPYYLGDTVSAALEHVMAAALRWEELEPQRKLAAEQAEEAQVQAAAEAEKAQAAAEAAAVDARAAAAESAVALAAAEAAKVAAERRCCLCHRPMPTDGACPIERGGEREEPN